PEELRTTLTETATKNLQMSSSKTTFVATDFGELNQTRPPVDGSKILMKTLAWKEHVSSGVGLIGRSNRMLKLPSLPVVVVPPTAYFGAESTQGFPPVSLRSKPSR